MFRWALLVLILTALAHVGLLFGFDWFGYSDILLVGLFFGVISSMPRMLLFWMRAPLHGWRRWTVRLAWLYAALHFVSIVGRGLSGILPPPHGPMSASNITGIFLAMSWILTCFQYEIFLKAAAPIDDANAADA